MDTWLIVLIIIAASLLFLFGMYILLIAPRVSKKEEMRAFCRVRYAHRGLHSDGKPENSIAAFEAAVQAGYGIELDVRLSKDGELVVFHDDTLDRMTGEVGRVDARTLAELKEIKLAGTEFVIPTFREVLDLVDGRVPLLVELKGEDTNVSLCEKLAVLLRNYEGMYCLESFNPLLIGKMKKHLPNAFRGLLYTNVCKEKNKSSLLNRLLTAMALNFLAKPNFIAYHQGYRNALPVRLTTRLWRAPKFVWTVRTEEELAAARQHGEHPIFEHVEPK